MRAAVTWFERYKGLPRAEAWRLIRLRPELIEAPLRKGFRVDRVRLSGTTRAVAQRRLRARRRAVGLCQECGASRATRSRCTRCALKRAGNLPPS